MFKNKKIVSVSDLFARHSEDILKYSFSILHNIDEAKDTLQDVFVKHQLSEKSFNGNCSYKTWLFTIARNICYNKLKEKRRGDSGLDNISFRSYNSDNLDDLISLKEGLKKLDPSENEIIFLRDYESYSYKEIASLLEISVDNVKVKLFRAKNKLRKILNEEKNVKV